MNTARSIPIAEIGDGGAQMRVEMKPDVVRDYADDMARNGVASGTAGMPGLGECEVIAFPYWRAGMAVNVKYRALSEKAFKQIEGGELRFWNLDEVLKAKSERVFIVEGEVDGLALLEAGVAAGEVMSVGTKGQALEGGHRVGASIRWPGVIEKGSLAASSSS